MQTAVDYWMMRNMNDPNLHRMLDPCAADNTVNDIAAEYKMRKQLIYLMVSIFFCLSFWQEVQAQEWIIFTKSAHAYHHYDPNVVTSSTSSAIKRVGVKQILTDAGVEDLQRKLGEKVTHAIMVVEINCLSKESRTLFVELFNNKITVLKEKKTTKWKVMNQGGTNSVLSDIVCNP